MSEFEVPEIKVATIAPLTVSTSSGNDELPFIPFSNNDDDELGFIIF